MIDVSNEIVIDLTEYLANVGKTIGYSGEFDLGDGLLTFPNAVLKKTVVDLKITFDNPNVSVRGTVTCVIDGYCDRCLEKVHSEIELPFYQIFYKDSAEDPDGYTYSNSKLDATKAICDEIILSMPSLLLCKEDCKGLCPKCGTNLNQRSCNCDTSKENVFSALKNLKF